MTKRSIFDTFMQIGLPVFTVAGFLLTGLKLPQWGLIASLSAQVFWIYSSHKAWKEAGQIGIFVNTIIVTIILIGGVINYWFL